MVRTTRKVICLRCMVEFELGIGEPCPKCGPEWDCLETIEVKPWYTKDDLLESHD